MELPTTVLPHSESPRSDGVKASVLLCAHLASVIMKCAISAAVYTHVSPFRKAQLLAIRAHPTIEKDEARCSSVQVDS